MLHPEINPGVLCNDLTTWSLVGSSPELDNIITRLLSHIFQESGNFQNLEIWRDSQSTGINWKMANIPVFRKSKKEEPDNYRPVSLTLVPVEIMEIIVASVKKQLSDSAVISHSQHRLIRGRPCLTNLSFIL